MGAGRPRAPKSLVITLAVAGMGGLIAIVVQVGDWRLLLGGAGASGAVVLWCVYQGAIWRRYESAREAEHRDKARRIAEVRSLARRLHDWAKEPEGDLEGPFDTAANELDRLVGEPAGDKLYEHFQGDRRECSLPMWGSEIEFARAVRDYLNELADELES